MEAEEVAAGVAAVVVVAAVEAAAVGLARITLLSVATVAGRRCFDHVSLLHWLHSGMALRVERIRGMAS